MSKMSGVHAELTEQAYDLGYDSLEAAFADGYESAYFCGDPVLFKRKHKSPDPLIHQPTLNKDLTNFEECLWEEEKACVLRELDGLYQWHLEHNTNMKLDLVHLLHAIDFVKRSKK